MNLFDLKKSMDDALAAAFGIVVNDPDNATGDDIQNGVAILTYYDDIAGNSGELDLAQCLVLDPPYIVKCIVANELLDTISVNERKSLCADHFELIARTITSQIKVLGVSDTQFQSGRLVFDTNVKHQSFCELVFNLRYGFEVFND